MVNTTLLEATLTHIKDHPELHRQSYFCQPTDFGMATCFGGRALLLAGYGIDQHASVYLHPDTKEPVNAWSEAKAVLGLDERWALNLFSSVNTRHMLERKVKDLLNGSPLDTYHELLYVSP